LWGYLWGYIQCREASPRKKDYKLGDGRGLYLLVTKKGHKYWRLKFRFAQKEKVLALGVYPDISLKKARDKTYQAKQQLEEGIDPTATRKAQKLSLLEKTANSFEVIAWEWFEKEKDSWSSAHVKKQKYLLEKNLLPYLGKLPITDITPLVLLDCLRKAESRGALETARRLRQVAGQIFRYAVITGRAERDPTTDLRGALKPPKVRHFPAITDPKRLGELLRAIDSFEGTPPVAIALKLAPLLFVRPGELRKMEWNEIDFKAKEWNIPATKMKMNQPHLVPLSRQAMELLKELEPLTGRWQYVFPSERSRRKPMSDNALNAALRRLGYSKDEVTTHGFRATARTLLDEALEFEPHLIEHQLAHEVKDSLGRAYNRTKHLKQRKLMMQSWSDYLNRLKDSR
jgi:integrase